MLDCLGHIDLIGTSISGWAYSRARDPITLSFDQVGIEVVHSIQRYDVKAAIGCETSLVGFSVSFQELLERWKLLHGGSEPFPKTVSLGARGRTLHSISLPDLSRCEGKLVGVETDEIVGWVISDPPAPVPVLVEVDGVELGYTWATEPSRGRPCPAGANWFSVQLPASDAVNALPIDVTAKIAWTNVPLAGSPFRVALPAQSEPITRIARSAIYGPARPITIVIPVYNAPSDLNLCLQSVIENTTGEARLVIVDDASTDRAVEDVLSRYAKFGNVRTVRNSTNLGFASSVNRGIELAELDDVVLLNSDTIVGARWLSNLRIAAYSHPTTGTVTPLSNNAGAFSAPGANQDNDLPGEVPFDAISRSVTQQGCLLQPSAPTGNGFCLFIKRDCLDEVGAFDDRRFATGYGEENDFCMRAKRLGWRHSVDCRTFVFHARSASFLSRRDELAEAARVKLEESYPEYQQLVKSFAGDQSMAVARYHVRVALKRVRNAIVKPRLLTVISTTTGGTPQTNADLLSNIESDYETFLLSSDSAVVRLFRVEKGNHQLVAHARLRTPISPAQHASAEYDELIAGWLIRFGIEVVHIRHLAWHGLGLGWVCDRLDIPTILSVHDFYHVCPSLKLLDEDLKFCGGICTAGEGPCNAELWQSDIVPSLKHRWVRVWREQSSSALEPMKTFVTTSNSAREIMVSNFPELAERPFMIIPHGRDFSRFGSAGVKPKRNSPTRLLAPGNLSAAKGAVIISDFVKLDKGRKFEIHTLGETGSPLEGVAVVKHGRYERDDFVDLAERIAPSFGLILSLWPETYCHTLTELWAAGIPVVAFDMGAVGERIREHGGGILVSDLTASAVYSALTSVNQRKNGYEQLLEQIRSWQRKSREKGTTYSMARRYTQLYLDTEERARPFRANAY